MKINPIKLYVRLMLIPVIGIFTTLFGLIKGDLEFTPKHRKESIPFFIVYHLLWIGTLYVTHLILEGEL